VGLVADGSSDVGYQRDGTGGQVNVTKREGKGAQCLASSRRQSLISGRKLPHARGNLSEEIKREQVQQQTRRMSSKGA
jgi:hypothetical protein